MVPATRGTNATQPDGAAVIVAAGSGSRMGREKTLVPIAGQPVIWHSATAFDQCRDVREIVVVSAPERIELLRSILESIRKPIHIVVGGATRQASVLAGLQAVTASTSWVAVHDAARPLITPDLISKCFASARLHGSGVAASPVTDTLQRTTPDGACAGPVDRKDLWAMQTPQVFPLTALRNAIIEAEQSGRQHTDETSVMNTAGTPGVVVDNPDCNFKVTRPADMELVEFILRSRSGKSHESHPKPAS